MNSTAFERRQFERQLVAMIPAMRAFARSMCRELSQAEDLAQEALAKAIRHRDQYQPGTNLKAWLFRILRNQFYSDKRREWRSTPLDQGVAEAIQGREKTDGAMELNDLRQALACLSDEFREALVLVGAGGLSYEEAAEIVGAPVGTVKSRVSRARTALANRLASGDYRRDAVRPSQALASIMAQLPPDRLRA